MKITKDWLKEQDACEDAVTRFCEVYPAGAAALNDVIQRLDRADWLLWLLGHTGTPHKEMVRIACLCARRALRHVPDGETRPLRAIEAAEAWVAKPSDAAARNAAAAADATGAAAARAARATDAAWAARASRAAWAAADAAWAAAWAAEAAWAREAARVAGAAADAAEHKAMCEMIRGEIRRSS